MPKTKCSLERRAYSHIVNVRVGIRLDRSQHRSHSTDKRGASVLQSEWHPDPFVKSVVGHERGSTGICQYPDFASNVLMNCPRPTLLTISSMVVSDTDDWTGHRTVRWADEPHLKQLRDLPIDLRLKLVGHAVGSHLARHEI